MSWFDENAPPQQDWFSQNAPSDVPTLEPQVVTPEDQSFFQDPGKYLWRQTPEAKSVAEGVRSVLSGLVPQSFESATEFATPVVGAVKDISRAGDAVRKAYQGEPIDQVNREEYPEAYRYENFGQQPLKQQVETVGGDVVNAIMGGLIGKGLVHGGAPEPPPVTVAEAIKAIPPETTVGDAIRVAREVPPETPIQAIPELLSRPPEPLAPVTPETPPAPSFAEATQGAPEAATQTGLTVYRGSDTPEIHPQFRDFGVVFTAKDKATAAQYGEHVAEYAIGGKPKFFDSESDTAKGLAEKYSGQKYPTQDDWDDVHFHYYGAPTKHFAQFLKSEGYDGFTTGNDVAILDPNILTKPVSPVTPPAEAPLPYTPEAAAARAAEPAVQPEETGISKAAIAEQREARELPAIERQKQIDFGESLDLAKATLAQDPMAGQRLVEELTAKPRSVMPEDTPLLIERMQQVQREFDAANRAVNEAAPEQLEVAKARLEHARTEYDKTVTATQNATSRTGAGLNSVKMILNEDYSLARMESRKRAANNGKIGEEQLRHTEALQAKITEVSNGLDALDKQRFGLRDVGKEAAVARKSGKRLTDYTGEAAQRARERINRQLHGLGARPAPPTLLYDYAVVGADHLARGLTKFSDWSAQMIKEFGEKVKPHLQDLWKMARAVHDATAKSFRTPEEVSLERYKTGLAKQTVGVTAKIQRGDFTKATRQQRVLDKAAYKMKGNLQRLKNEFERGVAKDAYNNMSPGDKFWQHFVGVERAMKLSSPGVFEKLGIAAAVREVLAPIEAGGGYAVSQVFPKLAEGTRYGAGFKTIVRAEIKAKAALFTEGMKDSWENLMGRETGLEAMSDKYGRQPDFWYNRIGKIHAAVKAPIKRAEFVRSLEHRMDAAAKAGEDINHPEVMDRLATESALDANRAIFQQNTVVSKFFSMLDRLHPAGGRVARFLQPVVRIPVNLFKEFVTYHVGAPAAVLKIGHAYWKGVETLPPVAREAIIRQLVKGSVGGAAILWGYYNREKVHDFFASVPPGFEHTPIAMAIHEGSIIKGLEEQGTGTRFRPTEPWKEATKMAKYDIPFMYTVTGLANALDPSDPNGWRDYLYGMIQSSVVPQVSSWTAKEMDKPTPFSIFDKPTYRRPTNIVEAITQGIPGLREDVPEYHSKGRRH